MTVWHGDGAATMAVNGMHQGLGDRYTIERQIGRGGMATVFLATDTKFARRVAIKVLDPELAAALGGERFHREIQIVNRDASSACHVQPTR
jgi:serine/threonine protein kinase